MERKFVILEKLRHLKRKNYYLGRIQSPRQNPVSFLSSSLRNFQFSQTVHNFQINTFPKSAQQKNIWLSRYNHKNVYKHHLLNWWSTKYSTMSLSIFMLPIKWCHSKMLINFKIKILIHHISSSSFSSFKNWIWKYFDWVVTVL